VSRAGERSIDSRLASASRALAADGLALARGEGGEEIVEVAIALD
jgi:hypothetical protein